MNIYLISQTENTNYDTYDSAVVYAESFGAARQINPDNYVSWGEPYSAWCSAPELVTVVLLGKAIGNPQPGIILASFNAR